MMNCPETSGNLFRQVSGGFQRFPKVSGQSIIDGPHGTCFFHSFCATDLNFGTKNSGRRK